MPNFAVILTIRSLGLMSLVLAILMGTYVFYKNPSAFVNRNFGLLALATCSWTFNEFMLRGASTPAEGLFWARLTWGAVIVLQAIALNFSLRISGWWTGKGLHPLTKITTLTGLILLGLLNFTD